MENLYCPLPILPSERQYECPCSKSYRSYPALYTHIKNKHQGKAPGEIKKPVLQGKKRGRPLGNRSRTSLESEMRGELGVQFSEIQNGEGLTAVQCVDRISNLLALLPNQPINRMYLNELSSMAELVVYMSSQHGCGQLGSVLVQFLCDLSSCVGWEKFRYICGLLMLFIQFIMQQSGAMTLLESREVDLLCEYLNQFIREGMTRLAKVYRIDDLEIFEAGRVVEIFGWFFRWLKIKNYTDYQVTRNEQFKREQTRSYF